MTVTFEAQRHVLAEGVAIQSYRAGSGPAVVMLHGYPQNHRACLPVARQRQLGQLIF